MSEELRVDEAGPVAVLAINRPAVRNALSLTLLEELTRTLNALAARSDLRVIVLRGDGELPFSAGYDMKGIGENKLSADDARKLHAPVRAVADALSDCPHVVVAAARQFVFGAALDLFLHCDLRLGAEGTTFCLPPNRYGFLYPAEGLQRLIAVAGLARAEKMLLTGEPIKTEEALACGIVQQVLPLANWEAGLSALCDTLAANAPLSMRGSKQLLRRLQPSATGSTDLLYQQIADCLNSEDVRESQRAFREKRKPIFRGA